MKFRIRPRPWKCPTCGLYVCVSPICPTCKLPHPKFRQGVLFTDR